MDNLERNLTKKYTTTEIKSLILSLPNEDEIVAIIPHCSRSNIKYILKNVNQTSKICRQAILFYPYALRHVNQQTDELCSYAISLDPKSLGGVKKQSYELIEKSLSHSKDSFKYIKIFACSSYDQALVELNKLRLKYKVSKT